MNAADYETFTFCGQLRYRCRMKQLDGSACAFDTYDLRIMHEHERGHAAALLNKTPSSPTLFDAEGRELDEEAVRRALNREQKSRAGAPARNEIDDL